MVTMFAGKLMTRSTTTSSVNRARSVIVMDDDISKSLTVAAQHRKRKMKIVPNNSKESHSKNRKLDEEEERQVKHAQNEFIQLEIEKTLPSFESIVPLDNECYELTGETYQMPSSVESSSPVYMMFMLLQYQTCKSFVQYTSDENEQNKQIVEQKKRREELMTKKRAIGRYEREIRLKRKRRSDELDQQDDDDVTNNSTRSSPETKRCKRTKYETTREVDMDDCIVDDDRISSSILDFYSCESPMLSSDDSDYCMTSPPSTMTGTATDLDWINDLILHTEDDHNSQPLLHHSQALLLE